VIQHSKFQQCFGITAVLLCTSLGEGISRPTLPLEVPIQPDGDFQMRNGEPVPRSSVVKESYSCRPASSCAPYTYFVDHVAIFDTTLWQVSFTPGQHLLLINANSGVWAGNVWTGSGIPGQEQSCAQRTGSSTCEAFVLNNGASFVEACKLYSWIIDICPDVCLLRLGSLLRQAFPGQLNVF
jgi:hypothetical protein